MVLQNKRGQGLSTSTIILLILGVVILVVLIWGFVTGWSSIQGLVNPSNVDSVVQDCSSACSVNSQYSYCEAARTLRANEYNLNVKSTCEVFSSEKTFSQYRIPACPTINCNLKCGQIIIDGKNGTITSSSTGYKYDVTSIASDVPAGQKCVIN
jgi:hypothetical protein